MEINYIVLLIIIFSGLIGYTILTVLVLQEFSNFPFKESSSLGKVIILITLIICLINQVIINILEDNPIEKYLVMANGGFAHYIFYFMVIGR